MARVKIKQPNINSSKKVGVKQSSSRSTQSEKPVFSFEFMQGGNHCIEGCHAHNLGNSYNVLKSIWDLGCLTWSDISSAPRHGLGYEKISRGAIQVPIPRSITDDVTFLAFRCIGKAPMVGFRDGATFYVVWIDFDFSVYSHG